MRKIKVQYLTFVDHQRIRASILPTHPELPHVTGLLHLIFFPRVFSPFTSDLEYW